VDIAAIVREIPIFLRPFMSPMQLHVSWTAFSTLSAPHLHGFYDIDFFTRVNLRRNTETKKMLSVQRKTRRESLLRPILSHYFKPGWQPFPKPRHVTQMWVGDVSLSLHH
jgi:hypothetical protein